MFQIRTAQLNVLIFESRHKTAQFSAAQGSAQLASAEMLRQKFITTVEKFEEKFREIMERKKSSSKVASIKRKILTSFANATNILSVNGKGLRPNFNLTKCDVSLQLQT